MNTHTSLFLFILTNFLLELVFSDYKDFLNYYRGNKINSNKEKQIVGSIPNNCQCDIDPESCQYLCSCDDNCPQGIALSWKERNENTYEKENNRTYSDRCIDKNLLFKYNIRRGLNMENQTEDISKYEKRNIENFCYSIDNSKKTTSNIQSLSALDKYVNKKVDILNNIVAYLMGNENNDQAINVNKETNNALKYIKITSPKGLFKNEDGYFSLYSGSSCRNSKNVEAFIPENYSCLIDKDKIVGEDSLKDIKLGEEEIDCGIENRYFVKNKLLQHKHKPPSNKCQYNILEIEFVIQIELYQYKIINCSINYVCDDSNKNQDYKFKNSIIFTSTYNNIAYKYSGYGGYLNDFPLKICDKNNIVYNEYYIVGKKDNGDCRYNDDMFDYLYNNDLPFYFNKNYTYLCTKGDYQIEDTTLYKKIDNINKIARYGSSSYQNINNKDDWIEVQEPNKSNDNNKNIILMKIKIRTKKIGKYSHKYIYDVNTTVYYDKSVSTDSYMFKLQYFDNSPNEEDSETIYNKLPPYPTFVPKIPDDILDPLINSDVDK